MITSTYTFYRNQLKLYEYSVKYSIKNVSMTRDTEQDDYEIDDYEIDVFIDIK